MALFPQSFIDDIKLHANIVQVIEEYVPLRKSGQTYKGLCPFHSERSPSFHVDPDKGFFHCFGCQVGGDVFKFLELHEKVGFQEAVRMLAQKFGLTIPEQVSGEPGADTALRERLLKVHEVAAAWFTAQLASPVGARARDQLTGRGLSADTIAQLGYGFAPAGRDALKAHLLTSGFPLALLLQSGLVVQREGGETVDRFRNRIMIPIYRDAGSVVAFGGRALAADQQPKYLNSPETPIYSKGRTLYGLHASKTLIRRLGFAVLVEGYFDFAQVHQAHAAPAVASCGTALTPSQAQLLRRFTTRVVLSFDPDAAGQNAAARSCELLVAEGFDVNVVVLDRGEDPDVFIRTHGGEAYRERLRTSRPYLDYLLEQAAAGVDFSRAEPRRQFLSRMLAVAARIPDAAGRDQFGDRIAHRAQVTEEVIRAEIRRLAVQRRTEPTSQTVARAAGGTLNAAERGLIWGLVHNSQESLAALATLDADDWGGLAGREIFELARTVDPAAPGGISSALHQRLSRQGIELLAGAAAADTSAAPPLECALALRRARLERDRAGLQREIDRLQQLGAGAHSAEIDALWARKLHVLRSLEQLT